MDRQLSKFRSRVIKMTDEELDAEIKKLGALLLNLEQVHLDRLETIALVENQLAEVVLEKNLRSIDKIEEEDNKDIF